MRDVTNTGTGTGDRGVVRRGLVVTTDPVTKKTVGLRAIAMSPDNLEDTWALPEVHPDIDFDDAASVKEHFGEVLPRDVAIRKYYAQRVAPLLHVTPETIENAVFEYGPTPFVLQSHIAGPVAKNAQNVHQIGDELGNSSFLTSYGKVNGTTNHPVALWQYWKSVQGGLAEPIARRLLDARLVRATMSWLKVGLPEFDQAGPVNLGKEAVDRVKANNPGRFENNSGSYHEVEDPTANGGVASTAPSMPKPKTSPRAFATSKRAAPSSAKTAPRPTAGGPFAPKPASR